MKTEAAKYKPGDIVILSQLADDGRWPDGKPSGIRIGQVRRALEGGGYRVALRIGNLGFASGTCKFAPKSRTVGAHNIVRLASSREIQVGAHAVILPLAVAS